MKTMAAWVVMAACLLAAGGAAARSDLDKAAAQEAATTWVAMTDAAKYADSWDKGGAIMQAVVTKAQWEQALTSVRSPLGAVKSRTLKSAEYTTRLPNSPEGEYVVIQYATSFEHRADMTETIIPMKDKDGAWRVAGYFIK
jgi:hypothetical protein